MKKPLISWFPTVAIVIASVFALPAIANAYSQTLNLSTGWNIISTPRVVASHSFSAPETSANFDIFILNASSTAGWSTMAEMGQSEFTPLYGYFIDNKTTSTQQLTLNYADNLSPADRLFQREFTHTGWYSIGIANPTYAKVQTAGQSNVGNAGNILNSLNNNESTVIDFTDSNFSINPSSVAVSGSWKAAVSTDLASLNDLRETKGYAVYITNANALYSGFQNTDVTPGLDSISPTGAIAGGSDFTLTANGYSFSASSTINWNGTPLTTTFISATQLSAIVPAANIASVGSSTVTVQNPNPNGGTSNGASFSISTIPTLTVTQDANTPTGNITRGQSQVTLAKFDIYAANEAMKIKFLTFKMTFASATTTLSNEIRNISLTDDAGGQVGLTIATPPSATTTTCDTSVSGSNTSFTGGVYTDCFGTSASPINYTVPANTTRVLSLKADVQTSADFTGIITALTGNTNNIQGLVSNFVGSSNSAQGSALNLTHPSITVTTNNALGNQNLVAGVTNQRINSYSFAASSVEGVNISNLSVNAHGSSFQNLKVLVNGTQFGTTQGTVSSGTTYTFSGSPFNVPAGNTVNVDVYADTLSSATNTISPATVLTGFSGSGASSFAGVSLASPINGQNITFAGSPGITISADSTQPPNGQITMGSTGNTLGVYRFTETTNIENVKVTDLNVVDRISSTASVRAAFSNLKIYNGSTLLGTAGSAALDLAGTGYIYSFHFNTPIIVPQANSVSITLKGDAASYASQGATDNSTHQFAIATTTNATNNSATSTAVALGLTSNRPAAVTLSGASGNAQTVLRSTLTVSAAALNGSAHSKASTDDIGTVTFSANSAGPLAINSTTITLGGSGASSTVAAMQLIDANGLDVGVVGEAVSSTSGNVKTWSFTPGFQVTAGGSYTFKVRVNSNSIPPLPNISASLTATIQSASDILYTDGLDASSTASLSLPASSVPITINSVTYPIGQ